MKLLNVSVSMLFAACSILVHPALAGADGCVGQPGLCVAVKFVSLTKGGGKALVSEQEARDRVSGAGEYLKGCGIELQLEVYETANAADQGLDPGSPLEVEINKIRKAFSTHQHLLIVARKGSILGNMAPAVGKGSGVRSPEHGVIVTSSGYSKEQVLAHEIGHHLGLWHVENDTSRLMTPTIWPTSKKLIEEECADMRGFLQSNFPAYLR